MIKKSYFIAFLFIFILTAFMNLNAEEDKNLEWPGDIIRGELDNGFSYIIKEHKKPEKRLLAWLVVEAGSILETEKQRGIAHYIEHMGFNGTRTYTQAGELVKYFQSIGVDMGPDINAFTSFDRTVYLMEVDTEKEEHVDSALTVLCDYGSFMLLRPEEIEKERGVILEELRLGSRLSKRLYEKKVNIILKDSLYPERLTIGTEETIKAFTPEDFSDFYSTWYRPDVMTLIVVGDCEPLKLEEKIKNIFAEMPKAEGDTPGLIVPFKPHEEIFTGVVTDPELEKTSVEIAYLRNPFVMNTTEDYRESLCDRLVMQMLNDRLDMETYKAHTPLIYAYCNNSGWLKSMNRVTVGCASTPGRGEEALEVLAGYIEGLRNYGFNDVERQEAQKTLLERLRKAKEEADTRDARFYVSEIANLIIHESVFLSPGQEYDLAEKILPQIRDEEIKERIDYLFVPVNMSAIIEAPEEEVSRIEEKNILCVIEEIIKSGGISYKLEDLDYSYDYTSLVPGEITERKDYEKINLTELKLSNGLTVLLKPTDFDRDTVRVKYVSPGGKFLESPFTPGMFNVAEKAWGHGGTEDLTQFEVERLLSGTNIHFETGGSTMYGIYGSSSSGELETLCQWLWQYIVRPGYRQEGIDYGIKLSQEHIRSLNETQEGVMLQAENLIFLPHNPLSVMPTEEELYLYTSPDELKKIQELSSVPSNSELIIVGAFKLDEGIKLACNYFGSIPSGEKPVIPEIYRKIDFPQGNTKRIIYKGMEDRCKGYVIFPGCMLWEEDTLPLDILSQILDMRCWHKIREEKSLAYSIGVKNITPMTVEGYGRVKVVFGTDPARVDEVIDALLKEIEEIKTAGPSEEELDAAKKIIKSAFEEDFQDNVYWLGALEGSSLFNFSPALAIEDYNRVDTITMEDIKENAIKYLDSGKSVILLALPEEESSGDEGKCKTE